MDALSIGQSGVQEHRHEKPFHVWTSDDSDWIRFYRDDAGFLMQFPDIADFHLSPDGATATCNPVGGTDKATLDHLFQNQVKPMMLSLRGRPVYHGAVIEHNGGCIALLGASGQGKSSLSASFARAGHRFLSDDLLVLEPRKGGYDARPGTPALRLWPDARASLLGKGCVYSAPVGFTDKERVLATAELPHCDQPRPLRAAVVLSEDTPDIRVKPISGADAVAAWMSNVFVLETDRPASVQLAFAQSTELARAVPSIALCYPRDYDVLPRVRDAILDAVSAMPDKGAVL